MRLRHAPPSLSLRVSYTKMSTAVSLMVDAIALRSSSSVVVLPVMPTPVELKTALVAAAALRTS